ncbi:flagellar basal-body rod protein FlgF [Pleionea sp. CnH1-48]|uniref:flagellar basal-body rod protein FlgF n=1 Tax=Pleionea sp. CnH1-48 TaxID=2954494 RepID=UPI002096C0BA|nr:flagellar basal-body rod protein FlgF [Pleionea sp. CnH1-48]MCO7223706.1 flagellar basal-body rod protein FlgF [Pleionea sp. CnH1-48]
MLQSFFNGLSGMLTFSRGLDTISNNISNMNTPGFRGSDVFYQALSGGHLSSGAGSRVSGELTRFSAGDIQQSDQDTHLAISGNGYFILRDDAGNLLYTRSGQFEISEGVLVDSSTQYRVMAQDEFGNLTDIDISGMLNLAPEATSQLNFTGNLSTGDNLHTVDGLKLFNSLGEELDFSYEFTNNSATTAGSWLISIKDEDGIEIATSEVRFDSAGTPLAGFNRVTVTIPASSNGTANVPLDVDLYFGEPGDLSNASSTAGGVNSTLVVNLEDGRGLEGLIAIAFNNDGEMELMYSNTETNTPFRLALAHFRDESALISVEGNLFEAPDSATRTIGYANQSVYGSIEGRSLESSNVDLVREFAQMIVVQRGYQASSRVMNISNQLIEQLYDSTGG